MAYVYSHSFLKSHAGAYAKAECPEGYRAVIRCITVFNANVVGQETGHLIHQPSNCTIFQWRMGPATVVEGGEIVIELAHFVFDYPEYVETRNDSDIDMTVSGYLLTLP